MELKLLYTKKNETLNKNVQLKKFRLLCKMKSKLLSLKRQLFTIEKLKREVKKDQRLSNPYSQGYENLVFSIDGEI